MFIKDLQSDFYNVINGKQCLILVNFDIDAICASKILQTLFKNDHVIYTLVPVSGVQDMVKAFKDNAEDMEYVVMINCGGNLDLVQLLKPEENVIFFIFDSHRPFNLCNIYSEKQIQIAGDSTSEEDIPKYEDIFNDESSDEEELDEEENGTDDENESHQAKRRRLTENRIMKKKRLREWEEKRDNIVFEYTQLSYYGRSTAVIIYEMAWTMSRDNMDMVWWAIVGFTEQTILNKTESSASVLESGSLQGHVSRLSHARGDDAGRQQLSSVKITYEKDLQLALYRHWTVDDSLKHSMSTAVALRLWSIRGEQKLRKLLADMGLPLVQSKQKFSAMDLSYRNEFKKMLEEQAEKYNISSIVGATFSIHHGYRFKYCASDVVYAMLAILESPSKERPPEKCFLEAADCLSRTNKELLDKGIEKSKIMLVSIFKTAQSILELKQVVNAGTLLYILLSEGTQNSHLFSHPHTLLMLANFVLKAYVEGSKNRKTLTKPLIASSIISVDEGTCIIVGIPPVSEEQSRSLFGQAFETAAKNVNASIEADYFDTTIARLKTEDRPKFLDALVALLH